MSEGRAIGILLCLAFIVSCSKQPVANRTHGVAGSPRQLLRSELSAAEQRYGIAPVPDGSVTYQRDVIVVGGGAEAIHGQSSNGFVWRIAADAPHVTELKAGKVLFMTSRAVGRVLDVRRAGGDLLVTLGPVDITEIVSEAHIHIRSMPVNFAEALTYTAADLPGKIAFVPAPSAARPIPVDYPTQPPIPVPDVSEMLNKNFKAAPFASKKGVGVRVTADGGGLNVAAEATVHLSAPTLDVHLDITGGKVKEASIELQGAAGLTWQFNVGTDQGLKANVNGLIQPDTDFSIPVGGIGALPLTVTVRQRFQIKTGLGVRNSTLSATGDYRFTGGFRIGYLNNAWRVAGPIGFKANQSMVRTGQGISMGVAGVTLANQMKVIAGVGAFGFASGPYLSFTSSVGAFRNSDIGMLACQGAVLDVKLSGGVGYVIPLAVTRAINSFLRGLNISFEIRGEGGLEPSEAMTIVEKSSAIGGCNVDKDQNAKGTLEGPV